MIDDRNLGIAFDNLRGLVQDLILQFDHRFGHYKKGTAYETARVSDVKVFIAASRNPRSITEIARDHGVTRQAIQSSVQRLISLNVVELLPHPKDHREKIVGLTDRGWHAREQANKHIGWIEQQCAEILGKKGLEQFRSQLLALNMGLKARQIAGDLGGEPEAAED